MKNALKLASVFGFAMAASAASAVAAPPPPTASAVYTTLNGQPAAVVPVFYKCTTKRGCGYYFYRKYGTPVVYSYPPSIGGIPVLGSLLEIPGAVVNGATGIVGAAVAVPGTVLGGTAQVVGGTAAATSDALFPALTLGLLR